MRWSKDAASEAHSLMHRLLEEDPPEVILGAVSHRFRQLILVREALDAREDLKILVERKVIFNNQAGKYPSTPGASKWRNSRKFYRAPVGV